MPLVMAQTPNPPSYGVQSNLQETIDHRLPEPPELKDALLPPLSNNWGMQ
jgi:hypothetical protein